jgi:hypothetical protein
MDFKQTNADLWKAAGGRPLANPSSFSKEFDAAMERANRREISPMADIYNPNMNSQIISSHRNPDGSSVVAYVNGETVTYDANGNYTGRTAGNDVRGLDSIYKQNTATGNSSDNSGNGLGSFLNNLGGDQTKAGSGLHRALQFYPPFWAMSNLKAFFEPEYDKGTLVGAGRDFLGRGEEKTTTRETPKEGTKYIDSQGVLRTSLPGENTLRIPSAGKRFVSEADMMENYPTGVTELTDVAGNVPGAGYSWGIKSGEGWERPTPSAMDTFNPEDNFGYGGPGEFGNSQNYNTGGGDNYGMTGEAGSGFGGFAEGTDAEDAASADAGYW